MGLSQKQIASLFNYSEGRLIWKERPPSDFFRRQDWAGWTKRFCGKPAGCVSKRGKGRSYRVIGLKEKLYFEHRLVALLHWGEIPEGKEVDHINGNGLDNRLENLRLVDRSLNNKNMVMRRDNTSGQTGVRFERGAWRARIHVGKRCVELGRFRSFDDAVKARKQAESGDFYTARHGSPIK